jgi:Flp pilus assembly protein TadG
VTRRGAEDDVSRADGSSTDGADEGSAVVETSLVLVLLVTLLLALFQIGFALHVRNTLVACAAEGARYAANADRTAADGAARTRELVVASLGERYATDVTAGTESVEGLTTVVVVVRAPMPLLGPLGLGDGLVAQGHAYEEAG